MNILSNLDNRLERLNSSKYFIGLMMILLNVGSKYLFDEFGELHNLLLTKKLIRRLMIFVIVFIAIRDIKISIIIMLAQLLFTSLINPSMLGFSRNIIKTFLFIIIVLELCNEKSKFCIIPNTLNKLDTNNDGKIDGDEIKNAFNLLIKTGHI